MCTCLFLLIWYQQLSHTVETSWNFLLCKHFHWTLFSSYTISAFIVQFLNFVSWYPPVAWLIFFLSQRTFFSLAFYVRTLFRGDSFLPSIQTWRFGSFADINLVNFVWSGLSELSWPGVFPETFWTARKLVHWNSRKETKKVFNRHFKKNSEFVQKRAVHYSAHVRLPGFITKRCSFASSWKVTSFHLVSGMDLPRNSSKIGGDFVEFFFVFYPENVKKWRHSLGKSFWSMVSCLIFWWPEEKNVWSFKNVWNFSVSSTIIYKLELVSRKCFRRSQFNFTLLWAITQKDDWQKHWNSIYSFSIFVGFWSNEGSLSSHTIVHLASCCSLVLFLCVFERLSLAQGLVPLFDPEKSLFVSRGVRNTWRFAMRFHDLYLTKYDKTMSSWCSTGHTFLRRHHVTTLKTISHSYFHFLQWCCQFKGEQSFQVAIWERHRQVFYCWDVKRKPGSTKRWYGILGFLFRFQDMALNSSCLQNRAMFCIKALKKMGRTSRKKNPSTILETR